MSVQHQWVGVGGECASTQIELKIIYGLKTSEPSDLDSFFYQYGRTFYMHIVCMSGGYSQ